MTAVAMCCDPSSVETAGVVVRLAGLVKQSVVDGPGLRLVVFAQGCSHNCPGCHNPESQLFTTGSDWRLDDIVTTFAANPLLSGITLSGGEPFAQAAALAPLARQIRNRGKNVWCYTGYTFEELLLMAHKDPAVSALLEHIDTLVDGRFELQYKSAALAFRGSLNQRIIDVPASLRHNTVCLVELDSGLDFCSKTGSWG